MIRIKSTSHGYRGDDAINALYQQDRREFGTRVNGRQHRHARAAQGIRGRRSGTGHHGRDATPRKVQGQGLDPGPRRVGLRE